MTLEQLRPLLSTLAGYGLNLSNLQIVLLIAGAPEGKVSMTEVSKGMGHTTAAATGSIDHLEKMGLVSRLHDLYDRRKVLVTFTPKGKQLIAKMSQELSQLRA